MRLAAIALLVIIAAPRPAHVIPADPSRGTVEPDRGRTGVPLGSGVAQPGRAPSPRHTSAAWGPQRLRVQLPPSAPSGTPLPPGGPTRPAGTSMPTVAVHDAGDEPMRRGLPRPAPSGVSMSAPSSPERTQAPLTREGIASHMGRTQGEGYLALPMGPGWTVTICGAGGCITRTSTDAGPSLAMQRAGRIADLWIGDFEAVCGVPASRGLCPIAWTVQGDHR